MNYFQPLLCGTSLPVSNPHAVSVHFPTMKDVAGYETSQQHVLDQLQSAYPRFRTNKLVALCADHIRAAYNVPDTSALFPVSSPAVFGQIEKLIGNSVTAISDKGMHFIVLDHQSPEAETVKFFLQHAGLNPSSRRAEDHLLQAGVLKTEYPEVRSDGIDPDVEIKNILAEAYGSVVAEDIFLANTGMNALYAVFDAIKTVQAKARKKVFIQLGWLYLDTMEIISKYSDKSVDFVNLLQLDELESYLRNNHDDVAAVFTEIPTNPLIQTVDLPRLSVTLAKYGIPLVIDSSIGTPFNVELFAWCDVVVESLTKFACGQGDTMMGAILLKTGNAFSQSLKEDISKVVEPPYEKDVRHLAYTIRSYRSRVIRMAENTVQLVEYLQESPIIKRVHWAKDALSGDNYLKICKGNAAVPGLLSIVFDKPLQHYYDRLNVPKGPSFGTEFTLTMPYVYLAHYDLATSPSGRKRLLDIGLDPELLRVSVGVEPINDIINVFAEL